MATVLNKKSDTRYASTNEYYGTSSDTKPTIANGDEVPDRSIYLELNTGDIYYYTIGTDTWSKFGG